jgi:hypothetical protein
MAGLSIKEKRNKYLYDLVCYLNQDTPKDHPKESPEKIPNGIP